jgi:hypothetical protein
MKISKFKHEGVNPDGTFKDRLGAVTVEGRVSMSAIDGGCGAGKCNCSEGHWISIVKPRTPEGVVEGMTVQFESHEELLAFKKGNVLYCNK